VRRCAICRPATPANAALITLTALALSLTTLSALAGTLDPIRLRVSGKEVALKSPPVTDGHEIYLPLDALSAFGVTYTVTRREETAIVALPNGLKTEVALARPGRLPMLPLSAIAKPLGIVVRMREGWCEVRRAGEPEPAERVVLPTKTDQARQPRILPEKRPQTVPTPTNVQSAASPDENPIVTAGPRAATGSKSPAESKIHLDLPAPKFGAGSGHSDGQAVQQPGGVENGSNQTQNPGAPAGPGTLASRAAVNPSVIGARPVIPGVQIEDVEFTAAGDNAAHIHFKTSSRVTPTTKLLSEPSRLAIDVPNSALETGKRDWEVAHPFLSGIHATEGDRPGITRFVLDLSRLVTYRVLPSEADGFTINLGLPRGINRAISELTVVVDPGHGGNEGKNPVGCSVVTGGQCIQEKNLTLSIAKRLQKLLEQEGATVLMTRTSDISVPLPDRPALAIHNSADMFVSIHIDDCPRPNTASGTTAYYSKDDPNGRALAHSIVENIVAVSGLPNRRARSDRERFAGTGMAVLHTGAIPSTLVEIGYINNARDRAKLVNPDFQETIAQAMFDGIRDYVNGALPERVAGPVVPVTSAQMR
jgi:N-acetylmuramoyl-L-alanine amidase